MSYRFRHAICNEAFEHRSFAAACRSIRHAGYGGIEIAPFTLAERPGDIDAGQRREYRGILASEGIEFAGLHWLMVSPQGLHVTTPDASLRELSWRHVVELIDLCADLGDRGIMVFGSPRQRDAVDGLTPSDAAKNFIEGLARVAPHASARGVTILVEALPSTECDVITSLAEAAAAVNAVNHPAIRTMFDTHNAIGETEPHAALVERYFDLIRHVHVNEMDGRHPGAGDYDFKPLLEALARLNYGGWVSLEVFDFEPGADLIASESLRYLEKEIEAIGL